MTRLALALLVLGSAPLAAGTIPEGGALVRLSGSALCGLGVGRALPGDKPAMLPVAPAQPQPSAVSR